MCKTQPRRPKPTAAVIEHLVFRCPLPLLQKDDNWQQVITDSLHYFIEQLAALNNRDHLFIRSDINHPLFPNKELFAQLLHQQTSL